VVLASPPAKPGDVCAGEWMRHFVRISTSAMNFGPIDTITLLNQRRAHFPNSPPPKGFISILVQHALDNAARNRSASSAASTATRADRSPAQRGGHRALGASNHVTAGLKTHPLSQAAFQSEFWHHSLAPCSVPCGQAPCFAPEHFFALSLFQFYSALLWTSTVLLWFHIRPLPRFQISGTISLDYD